MYDNHTHLLPLPKLSVTSSIVISTNLSTKKQRKRIKVFDLYDSEASDTENTTVESQEEEEKRKPQLDPQESRLCNESLTAFVGYYDNMSLTDSLAALYDRSDTSLDIKENADNLCTELQLYSFRKLK